ncbi:hypothetical protein HMPREF1531_01191 [Propionibacterium sp. oral taxon 192 str. F0372]|nr:hypothetical protein HMPREF1531_01191 [Propionibacterium sp. oral taxon 192 str. F0372]
MLCALTVVREARRSDGVVILASHDSDLEPALDEAVDLQQAKIETMCWQPPRPNSFIYQLRCERQRLWCTRMNEEAFVASRDLTPYR